jgi:two-component system sensor histidine kinase/response regulator
MTAPNQRILVVEDDSALLEGVRDILELAGYEVYTATNGVEGLEALRRVTPDLILSDIMMPRMDGHQFYEAVRSHSEWLSIPFIFLTAKGEKTDVRLGKRLGADDYITKPFEEEDLLVTVGSKLKRRAELRSVQDQEMFELRRTILTTLNHEFRTPLTYVTAYADMLQDSEGELSEDQFRDFLRGIQAGSERLRRLVEDFIFLVELETGEARRIHERRRTRLDNLTELVREAVYRYHGRAAQRPVTLRVEAPPVLPAVVGNADYLRDAIGRLVDNAIKFSQPDGGEVLVRVEADPAETPNRCVRVCVEDHGIGIAAEELPHIFDMFYQINRAKMEQQGSGSGLAIARAIAALHGGSIEVHSRVGEGSTFTLLLPAALAYAD